MQVRIIFYFAFLIGSLSTSLFSQSIVNLDWVFNEGGIGKDEGMSICFDSDENICLTGYFKETSDFDPGIEVTNLTSNGNRDIFVQKIDGNGNLIWIRQIGGVGQDESRSITTDPLNNIYLTGFFRGTVDFDPGPDIYNLTSNGSDDAFILKLNSDGDFLWVKQIGGIENEVGQSIKLDGYGNIITIGGYEDVVDFDPGVGITEYTSNGEVDIFVQKLDSDGNFIWVKCFGGSNYDTAISHTIDANENIYSIGHFKDNVDFDPGFASDYLWATGILTDVFVQKLNSEGEFEWAYKIGGTGFDFANSIHADNFGNVYSLGRFQSSVDFDPSSGLESIGSEGAYDVFIQKIDTSGNFIWARGIGGEDYDYGGAITSDMNGDIYFTGRFGETVDFDPSFGEAELTSDSGYDIFVAKFDSIGNYIWAGQNSCISISYPGFSILVDSDWNIYTTGYFSYITDFDPSEDTFELSSTGERDVFLQKFNQCFVTNSIDTQSACDTFTWINDVTYTESIDTATYTLTNEMGCDSIITLNLTLNNSTTEIDTIIACNQYTWIDGNTYTESNNTATYLLTTSNGCDSLVTLNLTLNSVNTEVIQDGEILSVSEIDAIYQWVNCPEMTPIEDATDQTFEIESNGNYAVIVTKEDCSDTSDCSTIMDLGTSNPSFLNNVSVYPNPFKNSFLIDLGKQYDNIFIDLKDLNQRTVYKHHYKYDQKIIIEENFPNGFYTLIIETEEGKSVIPLIK